MYFEKHHLKSVKKSLEREVKCLYHECSLAMQQPSQKGGMMPRACQCSVGTWIMPWMTCLNFWLALDWSGHSTVRSLKASSSHSVVLLYFTLKSTVFLYPIGSNHFISYYFKLLQQSFCDWRTVFVTKFKLFLVSSFHECLYLMLHC